mmetsp:Transcript_4290/g.13101  ORF Transcript_4290/g.13101 Transcript_4290/m.13101 type:complete len:222 (+) Transcript_4290:74-739(+)
MRACAHAGRARASTGPRCSRGGSSDVHGLQLRRGLSQEHPGEHVPQHGLLDLHVDVLHEVPEVRVHVCLDEPRLARAVDEGIQPDDAVSVGGALLEQGQQRRENLQHAPRDGAVPRVPLGQGGQRVTADRGACLARVMADLHVIVGASAVIGRTVNNCDRPPMSQQSPIVDQHEEAHHKLTTVDEGEVLDATLDHTTILHRRLPEPLAREDPHVLPSCAVR